MKTRTGVIVAIVLAVLPISGVHAANQQANHDDRHPNVVLIMTDDQGYGDLHCHGNELIDSPNLDRLATQSAEFDRFYVSPICAPTRAALMTGRYFLRTGVVEVVPDYLATMQLDEVTMAEAFKQAGYATGIFGKWHLGKWYPYHPNVQGFDEFLGFRSGAFGNYFDPLLEYNGKPKPTKGYIADVLTDNALDFIERHRAQPFFCYIPYNVPHSPFQVPRHYLRKYKARGLSDRVAAVYGMCENMDENVGRLLKQLDGWKLADNTIVLFLSDNGPNGHRYNAGMKGKKGNVDEGGVRVPLFVRWPGKIKPGTLIKILASNRDLLPTLVQLCHIPMPETKPLDGRSLAPLLLGHSVDWPERRFFSVRMDEKPGGSRTIREIGVRTDRWRLTLKGENVALYDMQADPEQKQNVAEQHPEVARQLRAAIDRWCRDVTSHAPPRVPIPVGYDVEPVVRLEAPDAHLEGNVSVKGKVPWDIYWIHSWSSTDDFVWWDVDVVQEGDFDLSMRYSNPDGEPPIPIQVRAGRSALTATLPATGALAPRPKSGPKRERDDATDVPAQRTVELGQLHLPQGRIRIEFHVRSTPGKNFRLNQLVLRRAGKETVGGE